MIEKPPDQEPYEKERTTHNSSGWAAVQNWDGSIEFPADSDLSKKMCEAMIKQKTLTPEETDEVEEVL